MVIRVKKYAMYKFAQIGHFLKPTKNIDVLDLTHYTLLVNLTSTRPSEATYT